MKLLSLNCQKSLSELPYVRPQLMLHGVDKNLDCKPNAVVKNGFSHKKPGDEVLSQNLAVPVSSPLLPFTSLFGMGRGGATALKSPGE